MHAAHATTSGAFSLPRLPGEFAMLFPSTPHGARLARRHAVEQLTAWGIPDHGDDSATIALLVAELTANAVQHGRVPGRGFRLRVTHTGPAVHIAVTDARPERHPRLTTPTTTSGRGLHLIDTLTERWGVTTREPGKTVWCTYRLSR